MSSTFDDLSQAMSSEEKKLLLGKIQQSLNLSVRDTDNIVSKAEGPDRLKSRLMKEVERLGIFDRFLLKIVAFFRNRPLYQVMADRKLGDAKTVLRERVPGMVSFSREELSPEWGKVLYDLFAEATTLKPVFDHLFLQKLTLEAGLLTLIREEHPSAIQGIEDLFSDREIAEVYRVDQKRSTLQAHLDERLETYIDEIPPMVFDRVRDRLRPLYYLRPLVQFPYEFLFELFGHNPDKVEVVKYPYFHGAPWRKAASILERLYYGIYLSTKLDGREGSLNPIWQGVVDRVVDEKHPWSVDILNQKMATLVRMAQDLAQRIPWKETLQWCFQDPYYGVKYILPQFSISDFYQSTLAMTLQDEMERRIPPVRQQLLAEERAVLFQDAWFQPLEFYVPGVGSSLGVNQRIRGFQLPETLGLLWGFLSHHFPQKFLPFHQSLVRLVVPGNRSSLQGINGAIEDLSALKGKIQQFDRSLHPDTEEGKEFLRLKYELSTKPASLRPFTLLVQNKDSQAEELVQQGLDALQSLQSHLAGMRTKNVPALQTVLKLPYLLEGQQETMEHSLDRLLNVLRKMVFVLKEAQSLES